MNERKPRIALVFKNYPEYEACIKREGVIAPNSCYVIIEDERFGGFDQTDEIIPVPQEVRQYILNHTTGGGGPSTWIYGGDGAWKLVDVDAERPVPEMAKSLYDSIKESQIARLYAIFAKMGYKTIYLETSESEALLEHVKKFFATKLKAFFKGGNVDASGRHDAELRDSFHNEKKEKLIAEHDVPVCCSPCDIEKLIVEYGFESDPQFKILMETRPKTYIYEISATFRREIESLVKSAVSVGLAVKMPLVKSGGVNADRRISKLMRQEINQRMKIRLSR